MFKVLVYMRSPASFREALWNASELEAFRRPLREAGLSTEVPMDTAYATKAKIFVHPDQYDRVLASIRDQFPDLTLKARHVIVNTESEKIVRAVLARLPSKERVKVIDVVKHRWSGHEWLNIDGSGAGGPPVVWSIV